ncbi:hypothetical protein IFR04_015488 [Cadophora malorum]|uniref:Uncharacterized protein n=1 Tax=Cadophora malorum TaxID=108018 RepID=A0A8H7T348_9HELO|nr:hypothetical protein IFR04_015488 [Cadophora malorum]
MQSSMFSFSSAICFALAALTAAEKSSEIEARQLKDDLTFCFGRGSYCGSALDLYDECSDLQRNTKDLDPWYECVCGNGYTATKISCNWCQDAYNLSYTGGLTEDQTESCQSLSYSIAPIPSSIQALQSSFNATYTGIVPGANNANSEAMTTGTTAPSATSRSAASVTSGGAAVTSASTPQIGISATRSSFLSTVTFNGGAAGAGATRSSTTTAEQQSATSTPSATPTGAAQGGRNGFAVAFSVFVSAFLGLVMA